MRRSHVALVLSVVLLAPAAALAGWDEGVAAFTSKNFQAAAVEFQKLVDQNPDGFQGHYMLGLSLEQLKRKSDALNHLRKAYDLNPNDLSVKMALGRSYSTNNRQRDAAQLLSSVDAGKLPAKQRTAFYQIRGQARLKTGDTGGALADFKQLARLNPSNAEIQFAYGSTAMAAGRLEEGVAALAAAVKAAPGDQDKVRAYANALVKKGRLARDKAVKKSSYTQAATVARGLAQKSPTFDNYMLLISAELGAGLYTQAIETGKAAVAKNNGDWLAHFYLGQAYSSAKQYRSAEEPLASARSLAAGNDLKMVWRQLGFVYEKQNKYSESIAAYQNAGDSAGATRVAENQETAEFNRQVEDENKAIAAMEEEAKAIEEELKKLQGGGGR